MGNLYVNRPITGAMVSRQPRVVWMAPKAYPFAVKSCRAGGTWPMPSGVTRGFVRWKMSSRPFRIVSSPPPGLAPVGETTGFVKWIADAKSDQLLGAAAVGLMLVVVTVGYLGTGAGWALKCASTSATSSGTAAP